MFRSVSLGRDSPETERRASDQLIPSGSTVIPTAIRSRLPDPKWTIHRFLEHTKELPQPAEANSIVIAPTLSTRAPTESDHHIPRIPVPNDREWLIDLRKRVQTAGALGLRSIISPFGGNGRMPLWAASYWVEVDIIQHKRAKYLEANDWLQRHRSTLASNLTARVQAGWQSFNWSQLNSKLKSAESHMLPDPDELLGLLSENWFEDPLVRINSFVWAYALPRKSGGSFGSQIFLDGSPHHLSLSRHPTAENK